MTFEPTPFVLSEVEARATSDGGSRTPFDTLRANGVAGVPAAM